MDFFSVLGLPREASAVDIKRAYRRLAMAWHPDRNRHPEATERFKQIRAAYEALQRRERIGDGGNDAADEPQAPRAPDIRMDLELSLEEAAFGRDKSVEFCRSAPCSTCTGTGEAGVGRSTFCGTCHGSGRVRSGRHGLAGCSACDGRGIFRQRTCPDCAGSGKGLTRVVLQVAVPGGMLPGDELRLAGQGEPGTGELAPGDLFLKLALRPHPVFELCGADLSCTMPVNALRLLAGGAIQVPGLRGMEWIELEAGDIGARSLRLPGRGYPGRRSARPGDLVVHLQPVLPRSLDARQRDLLLAAAAACDQSEGECLAEIAAWRQRYGF